MSQYAELGFTIYDVLALGGAQQIGKPSQKGEIKVLCPCGVKTAKGHPATFDVNLAKGNFKCYRECAGCVGHGGMLDLYNLLCQHDADRKAARAEILDRLGRGEVEKIGVCPCRFVPQEKQSAVVDADVLDRAYRAFLGALQLNEKHKADLLARGLTESAIQKGLYRSVPQRKEWANVFSVLREKKVDFRGVPGFYVKNGKYHAAAFRKGFFIPYFDAQKRICGMQIRFDTVKEGDKRYLWFSSAGYEGGCSAQNSASFGAPGVMPVVDAGQLVVVTEGALKAAIANVLDAKHHPIIAIAGVSCYGPWREVCQHLQCKGVRFVADAFDADRETNPSVMRSLKRLYEIAAEYGIAMKRLDWGTKQKGVDDFLFSAAIQTENGVTLRSLWDPRSYTPPVKHIYKKVPAAFIPPVKKPKKIA